MSRPEPDSLRQTAARLGVRLSTARKLVRTGDLPAKRQTTPRGPRYAVTADDRRELTLQRQAVQTWEGEGGAPLNRMRNPDDHAHA